jgi:hypothetical protein
LFGQWDTEFFQQQGGGLVGFGAALDEDFTAVGGRVDVDEEDFGEGFKDGAGREAGGVVGAQ